MSFSFSSLIRLLVVMALGSTMLAVGLSKLDPPKPGWRTRREPRYFNINDYYLNVTDRSTRWLDAETGQVRAYAVEDGDILEAASCSPWVDEKGLRQVAGRWSSRTNDGAMSVSTDFGLARYSFPGGQLLDHVSTEIVPVGPPCWFPGTRASILFAAGDGELYHYSFEQNPPTQESDPAARRDLEPKPLKWRCPKPGVGKVYLSDITWPEDPRMGGCVVVSLRDQTEETKAAHTFTPTRLWWLKLNLAGTEIVEAGQLVVPDTAGSSTNPCDERSPTVGTLADGSLAVAYMYQQDKSRGWELRLAPIELEGDRHVPKALESRSRRLASNCLPSHPSFSADGSWLNTIVEVSYSIGRLARLSIAQPADSPK